MTPATPQANSAFASSARATPSAPKVPIIASAVGGNPEIVQDGVTGLLVPPADGPALQEGLARLLGDRRLRDRLAEEDAPRVELMLFDILTVSFWDTAADTETLAVTDSVPARLRETLPLADTDA